MAKHCLIQISLFFIMVGCFDRFCFQKSYSSMMSHLSKLKWLRYFPLISNNAATSCKSSADKLFSAIFCCLISISTSSSPLFTMSKSSSSPRKFIPDAVKLTGIGGDSYRISSFFETSRQKLERSALLCSMGPFRKGKKEMMSNILIFVEQHHGLQTPQILTDILPSFSVLANNFVLNITKISLDSSGAKTNQCNPFPRSCVDEILHSCSEHLNSLERCL